MSNLFKAIMLTFVVIFMISIYSIFYSDQNSVSQNETSYNTNKTVELKKSIEQYKSNKEEWEKQNPELAEKLLKKDVDFVQEVPTIGMSIYQIERVCGQPDHSSKTTTIDGTINAYTYRKGNCRGVLGFDVENKLVIINSY